MSIAEITIFITRLAEECAELEPAEEQAFAEEGFAAEADLWPPY